MKKGFTLIELLVVVAIVALLLAIIMPVLGKAREGAKVTAVGAELYAIGLALETYGLDNNEKFPPTRVSCMIQSHFHQLPDELAAGKYLPDRPKKYGPMSTAFEDRFNPDHTYKYHAAGDLIMNMGSRAMKNRSKLWVPDGFPEVEKEDGAFYNNPKTSPVTWVVYSPGPNFDENDPAIMRMRYPVPSSTWYNPSKRKGCITRIRLLKGQHIGSF